MGMLTRRDIKPFAQQAFVHGTMTGDVFYADEVGILEKTRAKLIYVTTCPVPGGYPPAPKVMLSPTQTSSRESEVIRWSTNPLRRPGRCSPAACPDHVGQSS